MSERERGFSRNNDREKSESRAEVLDSRAEALESHANKTNPPSEHVQEIKKRAKLANAPKKRVKYCANHAMIAKRVFARRARSFARRGIRFARRPGEFAHRGTGFARRPGEFAHRSTRIARKQDKSSLRASARNQIESKSTARLANAPENRENSVSQVLLIV
ncbi:hypothetical protein A374_10358 [Fictibacillus macauensis ZFHKF-1]|uniref:Uncharacterized protein n=1 Tax=Fictibacillus macauensis ZFHKF-1 TaxID=1196324 RepID=I8J1M0_9BACL|nr:hypothetical protein A374_10358 [Fictibacillus macauensis ZFHKF-1]